MDITEHVYRLAIDFIQVKNIPPDPRQRLPYFQAFKKLLRKNNTILLVTFEISTKIGKYILFIWY